MNSIFTRFIALFLTALLILPPQGFAQVLPYMPPIGKLVLPDGKSYDLPYPVGMRFKDDDLFRFTFTFNKGDTVLSEPLLRAEVERIGKYFLAALTIPEKDLWVNLSPYEHDRIIPEILGVTDLGQDLLGEDYVLKQLAASLTHPDTPQGKEYWNTLGNFKSQISNLPSKVWIKPGQIKMLETGDRVVITQATLKVSCEKDSPAMQSILPMIEKEVNEGKQFTRFRQMYRAIILAGWFKRKLQDTVLNDVYFNKSKVDGARNDDPAIKEKIYNEYVRSFNAGAYNLVKKYRTGIKITKRQYFSGGADMLGAQDPANVERVSAARISAAQDKVDGVVPMEVDWLAQLAEDGAKDSVDKQWLSRLRQDWQDSLPEMKILIAPDGSTRRSEIVPMPASLIKKLPKTISDRLVSALNRAHNTGTALAQDKLEQKDGFWIQREGITITPQEKDDLDAKLAIIHDAAAEDAKERGVEMSDEEVWILTKWFTDRMHAGLFKEVVKMWERSRREKAYHRFNTIMGESLLSIGEIKDVTQKRRLVKSLLESITNNLSSEGRTSVNGRVLWMVYHYYKDETDTFMQGDLVDFMRKLVEMLDLQYEPDARTDDFKEIAADLSTEIESDGRFTELGEILAEALKRLLLARDADLVNGDTTGENLLGRLFEIAQRSGKMLPHFWVASAFYDLSVKREGGHALSVLSVPQFQMVLNAARSAQSAAERSALIQGLDNIIDNMMAIPSVNIKRSFSLYGGLLGNIINIRKGDPSALRKMVSSLLPINDNNGALTQALIDEVKIKLNQRGVKDDELIAFIAHKIVWLTSLQLDWAASYSNPRMLADDSRSARRSEIVPMPETLTAKLPKKLSLKLITALDLAHSTGSALPLDKLEFDDGFWIQRAGITITPQEKADLNAKLSIIHDAVAQDAKERCVEMSNEEVWILTKWFTDRMHAGIRPADTLLQNTAQIKSEPTGGADFYGTQDKLDIDIKNGGLKMNKQKALEHLTGKNVTGFFLTVEALRY